MIKTKQILNEEVKPEEVVTDILRLRRNHPVRYYEIIDDWREKLPNIEQMTSKKEPEIAQWVQSTISDGRTGYETIKNLSADIKRAASGIREGRMITIKTVRENLKKQESGKKTRVAESRKRRLTEGELEEVSVKYEITQEMKGSGIARLNWGTFNGQRTIIMYIDGDHDEGATIRINYDDMKNAMESFEQNFNQ